MRAGASAVMAAVAFGAFVGPALGEPTPASRPAAGVEAPLRTPVPLAPPDSDLQAIRDIFHFGDEGPAARPAPGTVGEPPAVSESTPAPATGPRLVGLVRRPEGLQAAIAIEGEIVLVGRDDSALGYTVVDVSEERVILRDPTGEESVLTLGPG